MAASNHAPVGNMIIGQSGGPTMVINQSLVGAILAAQKNSQQIQKVFGAVHGVQGILQQDLIDLSQETPENLERVAVTPGSALGSVRKKPTEEECHLMFDVFRAQNVRYFFYIGGNDSAETAHIVHEVAQAADYDLRVFHIPKTIDNDLNGTDHCPGYGSAAKFVAQAFMGDDMDNRSLRGVKINVVMGRHAGFLTAAAALARQSPDSGPHLIYVPEVPFDEKQFVADVMKVHKQYDRCLVAVSEGIADASGTPIATKFMQEVDSHGNVQLSGSGSLGDFLTRLVKDGFGDKKVRARADTFGYLQRSFCGVYSKVDAEEARKVGELAVEHAVSGHASGTISLIRQPGEAYKIDYQLNPLSTVARVTTELPGEYINEAHNNVSDAFLEYARPLVGDLPEIGFLQGPKVDAVEVKR